MLTNNQSRLRNTFLAQKRKKILLCEIIQWRCLAQWKKLSFHQKISFLKRKIDFSFPEIISFSVKVFRARWKYFSAGSESKVDLAAASTWWLNTIKICIILWKYFLFSVKVFPAQWKYFLSCKSISTHWKYFLSCKSISTQWKYFLSCKSISVREQSGFGCRLHLMIKYH